MMGRDTGPERSFEVRLRERVPDRPMSEDPTYRWVGAATDEADAVVTAKAQARADGWHPAGPVAYRVVEQTAFLPVPHEWVESA